MSEAPTPEEPVNGTNWTGTTTKNNTHARLFVGYEHGNAASYQGRLAHGIGEYYDDAISMVYIIGTQVFRGKMLVDGFGGTPYAALNQIMESEEYDDINERSVFIICNGVVPHSWLNKENVFLFHGDLSKPTTPSQFDSETVQARLKDKFTGKCVLCALGMDQDVVVQHWLKDFVGTNDAVRVDHVYEITTSSRKFFPPLLGNQKYDTTTVNATLKQFFAYTPLKPIELSHTVLGPLRQAQNQVYQGDLECFREKLYKTYLPIYKATDKASNMQNPKLVTSSSASSSASSVVSSADSTVPNKTEVDKKRASTTTTKSNKKQRLEPCTLKKGDKVELLLTEGDKILLTCVISTVFKSVVTVIDHKTGNSHILTNAHLVKIIERAGKAFDGEFRGKKTYHLK